MATAENIDHHDGRLDVSIEERTGTTTCVNGGEDVIHNDKPDISDTSEEDDAKSIDSSFHTHFTLHPNTSVQKAEAHGPFPSSLIIVSPARPR